MAKITLKDRKGQLATLLDANVGSELTEQLVEEIKGVFGRAQTSNKVNENGEVYCNYFKEYFPEDQFATNKKGKLDSMSKEGKRLFRTQKSMVNRATNEVLKEFRAKDISAQEMEEMLNTIEANSDYRYPVGTESIPENYPFEV